MRLPDGFYLDKEPTFAETDPGELWGPFVKTDESGRTYVVIRLLVTDKYVQWVDASERGHAVTLGRGVSVKPEGDSIAVVRKDGSVITTIRPLKSSDGEAIFNFSTSDIEDVLYMANTLYKPFIPPLARIVLESKGLWDDGITYREINHSSVGEESEPLTAAAQTCPPATQSIEINIANRQKAIDAAGYGPLNPKDPNIDFWRKKAERWSTTYAEARKSLCGNCSAFIRTETMLDCIAEGLDAGGSDASGGWDTIDAGELGYCEAFDFKCAASRTCDAWIVGGPITEEK